ncbi:MAG TPA: DUF4160 domain-containing protein [Phycisphaerales bacterium]|nr:DUF4160 domain-containing protein [Phycisphaerales bacterium]
MPTVFRHKGYRFFFYSNEGIPPEPLHIHVRKGEQVAKIWLEPEIVVDHSYGMKSAELKELCAIVADNKQLIREFWNEHFND